MRRRWVDSDIWTKRWWREATPAQKCLWKYLCDVCDNAGVWSPDWALASFQIGEQVSEHDLAAFGDNVTKLPNGSVYLPTFVRFQQGSLKPGCNAHAAVIRLMKSHGLTVDDAAEPGDVEEPATTPSNGTMNDAGVPTLEEVIAHGDRAGATQETCRNFFAYHEDENLWLNRSGRLINWRSKLLTWRDRDRQQKPCGRNGASSQVADRIHDQKSLSHWESEVVRLRGEMETDGSVRPALVAAKAKVKDLKEKLYA